MKLYEVLYREIATDFLRGINKFTQKELSIRLHISIGNINMALGRLESINAVTKEKRSFYISALDKLLLYWASYRRLNKDIVYTATSDLSIIETESNLPNGIAFTAYTAYKKIYNTVPADYSEIFAYATDDAIRTIKQRFPKHGKFPNLFVLAADRMLSEKIVKKKTNVVPVPNLFVDLWNIKTWYAKDFVDALSKKLFG